MKIIVFNGQNIPFLKSFAVLFVFITISSFAMQPSGKPSLARKRLAREQAIQETKRKMAMSPNIKEIRLETTDGGQFVTTVDLNNISLEPGNMLKTVFLMIEDLGTDQPIPLYNISAQQLELILKLITPITEYLRLRARAGSPEMIELYNKLLKENVTDELNKVDIITCLELLQVANYLDMQQVIDILYATISEKILSEKNMDSLSATLKYLKGLPIDIVHILHRVLARDTTRNFFGVGMRPLKSIQIKTKHFAQISTTGRYVSELLGNTLLFWDTKDIFNIKRFQLLGQQVEIVNLLFSHDDRFMVTTDIHSRVYLWDLNEIQKKPILLPLRASDRAAIAFNLDSSQLIMIDSQNLGGRGEFLNLNDLKTVRKFSIPALPPFRNKEIKFIDKNLISIESLGDTFLIDFTDINNIQTNQLPTHRASFKNISAQCKCIAILEGSNKLGRININSIHDLTFAAPEIPGSILVKQIFFSTDNNYALLANKQPHTFVPSLELWKLEETFLADLTKFPAISIQPLNLLMTQLGGPIADVMFSSDNSFVIIQGKDRLFFVDLKTFKHTQLNLTKDVQLAQLSPDNRYLILNMREGDFTIIPLFTAMVEKISLSELFTLIKLQEFGFELLKDPSFNEIWAKMDPQIKKEFETYLE